jgi:chromatin segregation and condensation protein Rec8/ScpA/Scc1 (kleisin family)
MSQEQFYDDLEQELARGEELGLKEEYELLPRLPQARRRKVSVYDLVKALEKALEVKQRRVLQSMPPPFEPPARKFDVTAALSSLFQRILSLFGVRKKLTFKELLPGETKQDKVYTFIPLLHLSNQQKVELEQAEPFGDIHIKLPEGKNVQQ